MVLGMTGGAWTAPYLYMNVQEYPYATAPHGATCGACTTTSQTGVQSEQVRAVRRGPSHARLAAQGHSAMYPECLTPVHAVCRSSSREETPVRVTRVTAPMVLGMTGGV